MAHYVAELIQTVEMASDDERQTKMAACDPRSLTGCVSFYYRSQIEPSDDNSFDDLAELQRHARELAATFIIIFYVAERFCIENCPIQD
jgi:hypothetical protein